MWNCCTSAPLCWLVLLGIGLLSSLLYNSVILKVKQRLYLFHYMMRFYNGSFALSPLSEKMRLEKLGWSICIDTAPQATPSPFFFVLFGRLWLSWRCLLGYVLLLGAALPPPQQTPLHLNQYKKRTLIQPLFGNFVRFLAD